MPSSTLTATAHAAVWCNLRPAFVDCLDDTLTIDPDSARRAIDDGTTAIVAVSVFGMPPDIDRLETLAHDNGLKLILDSAQALGAKYRDEYLGGFGDVEAFSLSPTKVITGAEGVWSPRTITELPEQSAWGAITARAMVGRMSRWWD